MGKVGSSSLHRGLLDAGVASMHIHYLAPHMLGTLSEGPTTPGHVKAAWRAREGLTATGLIDVPVISAVRNCLDRNVSAFLENINRFGFDPESPPPLRKAISAFLSEYPHHVPDRWLRDELCAFTGIRLQDLAANQLIHSKSGQPVVICRIEDGPDSVLATLRLAGFDVPTLPQDNVLRDKRPDLYKLAVQMREELRKNNEYMTFIRECSVTRIFY